MHYMCIKCYIKDEYEWVLTQDALSALYDIHISKQGCIIQMKHINVSFMYSGPDGRVIRNIPS